MRAEIEAGGRGGGGARERTGFLAGRGGPEGVKRKAPTEPSRIHAQALVGQLHANEQRWVLILDPCIHVSQNYTPYTSGIAQDVFVKDITGRPFLGQARGPLLAAWVPRPARPVSTVTGRCIGTAHCLRRLCCTSDRVPPLVQVKCQMRWLPVQRV